MKKIKNIFFTSLNKKQRELRLKFITSLFVMFAFFITHNYIHNPYHASHDSSCSVYVLEELFFAGDLEIAPPIVLLFIPFFQIFFIVKKYDFKRLTYANIRAPPLQ